MNIYLFSKYKQLNQSTLLGDDILLLFPFLYFQIKQVALLRQRDRATRLSVEILQLQNIPFEN